MAKPLPREDSQPWYRQFWPWFLIFLPASMVVAGLTTLVIANRHADDLVADDYYRDGLAINRQLEKKQLAEQRGISARLRLSDDSVLVSINGQVTTSTLSLRLSHPLESNRDFQLLLERVAPGQYRGTLTHTVGPHWYWILEPPGADRWQLNGSLVAADFTHGDSH